MTWRLPRWRRGRLRYGRWLARAGAVALPIVLMAGLVAAGAPWVPQAAAAIPASTFTKTGQDATTGSSASSAAGKAGTTRPGDTIKWVLHYTNNTGAQATVGQTDPITGNQAYVPGSLVTPPGLSGRWSTDGGATYQNTEPRSGVNAVGGAGTVQAGTTSAASHPFSVNTVNPTTPGGDGFTVEGQSNELYTVFHHDYTAAVVYCATLAGAICPGWPGHSTYVNPTPGTHIGTGAFGQYTTADINGSFLADGRLYWPVEDRTPSGGKYAAGLQCLNLTSLNSCGFIQLGTEPYPPSGNDGLISGDGIAAANGNYYFFDDSGDMLCFNALAGPCGNKHVTGAQIPENLYQYPGDVLTSGRYFFATFNNQAADSYTTCFDTAASALCPGFPANDGPAPTSYAGFVAPVLSASGTLLGACDVAKAACHSPTGTALANPYAGHTGFGFPPAAPSGFGSGEVAGPRFYAGDLKSGAIDCFDFSSWTGSGPVPACSGFTGQVDARNYTVRSPANLPGCMAADGDAGQILLFNAKTGGQCATATTTVAQTDPSRYYCDGKPGHASKWGTLTLKGLTGSEYAGATVTLTGASGPVPGFTDLRLRPGQLSLSLASLPVSGNTASLAAQVTLGGVTNSGDVAAANVVLSWTGDPIQTCFETRAAANCPPPRATLSNAAKVVTTGSNGVTDAPHGTSSGTARFAIAATASQCALVVTITASEHSGQPGDKVTYRITVSNKGSDAFTKASPATFTDSLSQVLADAMFNHDATASAGAVSYDAPELSWSGPLAAGKTATVVYSVTVASNDTGAYELRNRVVSPLSNCAAGAGPRCSTITTITNPYEVPVTG